MERQQLLDALTDHMAVYHCRQKQMERRHCGDKGDRHKVVQWLTGLSVAQRQAAFTIVDEAWVAVLLQMQKRVQSEGPGSFFVLPDFPSQKQNAGSTGELLLPSLCFRRARGLLRRLSCEGESLVGSLRLYSSLDGEVLDDSSRKLACRSLDCLTVSSEFLKDVNKLVEAMDKLSYGEFLASQCFPGGSSWEETPWLKAMGYYSLPAFVANRLEISLWSAWISALGTKQPPRMLSRSVARAAFDSATIASRICTKRRGFEDWWNKLSMNVKNRASKTALANILKFEASKIDVPIDELTLEVIPSNNSELPRLCLGIQVLSEVRSTLNKRVLYSSLAEVHGFAEQVVQAVRNILMKVMKDSMEYELLDHGGKPPKVSAKKLQAKARKTKNKKQKRNASHKCCSAAEEQSTEFNNLVVETTTAPQQQMLETPDTGWVSGKKKKRNKHEKKVKPDAPSRIPGELSEREDSTQVEENNSDSTLQEPSSTASEPTGQVQNTDLKCQPNVRQVSTRPPYVKNNQAIHLMSLGMPSSHEWPGASRSRFSGLDSSGRPAATEWLHLDVNRDWQHHAKQSLYAYSARPTGQVDTMIQRGFLSKANMSWDWPPMVQTGVAVGSPFGFVGQAKEEPGFVPVPLHMNGSIVKTREIGEVDEGRDTDDDVQGDCDDYTYRNSEGEGEKRLDDPRQVYEVDYNQIFGGGVMYWTSADYTGMGYSRPGSLSSEESSWARREADLTVVVDDIVGLPSVATPYPGLSSGASCTSPSSASSLSFEHLAGTSAGNEVQGGAGGKAEILKSASQPVLPPIAVRESKSGQVSKLDGSKLHEARSPHVPRGRREFIRWKRSPSPVLRCVPPAPPPPPPSPVAGVRKRRGFPTVRSGSSSPRHWGVFNWPDSQLKTLGPEGIVPAAWRTRCFPNTPVHPLTGALLRERLVAIPQLALEQEHPDVAFPMKTGILHQNYPTMATIMSKLHKEIEAFCLQVAAENAARKPYVNIAVKKVTHAIQVLWPRSRTKIFGSNATGLALPNSDVDLVVCLPPVRNLEPIKEAGILEGRNGIKETCLQHAARYLADQDWVKSDSLKTIENTTIPIIMLVAKCFPDNSLDNQVKTEKAEDIVSSTTDEATSTSGPPWGTEEERHFIRLDISFESASHTGVLTAELVKELVNQFPAITPLALVLKQFLTDRGLDQPYTGGLSSYCLVLLITRFLQHQFHLGWPSQVQSLGSLLMDFLHFFGCVFDPRRMCISIRGGGMYVNRDRLHGIDPLHIEDPLHSMNNVGRNCFRILQCTKAFADAYVTLEKELITDSSLASQPSLLSKILPSFSAEF